MKALEVSGQEEEFVAALTGAASSSPGPAPRPRMKRRGRVLHWREGQLCMEAEPRPGRKPCTVTSESTAASPEDPGGSRLRCGWTSHLHCSWVSAQDTYTLPALTLKTLRDSVSSQQTAMLGKYYPLKWGYIYKFYYFLSQKYI